MRNFLRKYAEARGHFATAVKSLMDEVGDKAPPKDSYLKLTKVGNVHYPGSLLIWAWGRNSSHSMLDRPHVLPFTAR